MKLNTLKPEIFVISLALFPLIFISGPFLSDLFIVIFDVYFIYYFFNLSKEKRKYFIINFRLEIFILTLLWLFSIVSSINSEFVFNSLMKSFFHVRFYIFLISVIFFLRPLFQNEKLIKIFYLLIVTTIIIISTSMYIEILVKYLYNNRIIDFVFNEYQLYRFSGLFFDEQIIGSFIIKILIIYSLLLYHLNNYSLYNLFLLLLGIITIFISGERMATLLTMLYFSFYFLFTYKHKNLKNLIILLTIFILVIFSSFTFNKNLNDRYQYFYQYLKDVIVNKKSLSEVAPNYNYIDLFKSGYYVWTTEKVIGVGVRNYRNVCKIIHYEYHGPYLADKACDIHPHNIYSELLAETGIVGIILFLSFIFTLIFKTLRYKKLNFKDKLLITFCIVWLFWPIASTGSYFNNYNSTIIWYLLGFILYNREKNEQL